MSAFIAIIPVHQGSKRFPHKFTQPINGKPMIWHIYRNIVESADIDCCVVAFPVEDARLRLTCMDYKIPSVYTYEKHETGSDRCYEAARRIGVTNPNDVIINLQGDEPLIGHQHLKALVSAWKVRNSNFDFYDDILTCVEQKPLSECTSQDVVKVSIAVNDGNFILDFYRKNKNISNIDFAFVHYGLTAFRFSALKKFAEIGRQPLTNEATRDIELQRCIDNNIKVRAIKTDIPRIAVDRPDDIKKVEDYLNALRR